MLSLQIIYDSGLDVDRVHITPHINGTGAMKELNRYLAQAEPVYTNIPDSDSSGQGFKHECDIGLIHEWPIDENSKTEATEAIAEHLDVKK